MNRSVVCGFLAICGIGAVVVCFFLWKIVRLKCADLSATAPSMTFTAERQFNRRGSSVKIEYSFVVNGRVFTGGGRIGFEPAGSIVTVYYDPSDPCLNTADPSRINLDLWALGYLLGMDLVLAGGIAWLGLRRRG